MNGCAHFCGFCHRTRVLGCVYVSVYELWCTIRNHLAYRAARTDGVMSHGNHRANCINQRTNVDGEHMCVCVSVLCVYVARARAFAIDAHTIRARTHGNDAHSCGIQIRFPLHVFCNSIQSEYIIERESRHTKRWHFSRFCCRWHGTAAAIPESGIEEWGRSGGVDSFMPKRALAALPATGECEHTEVARAARQWAINMNFVYNKKKCEMAVQ